MAVRRILCVDDHADMCALIAAILTDYEVITASSKSEGLRMAQSQHFDLILLDYHLGDGVGPELSKQIREFNPHIPILFVTSTYTMTMSEVSKAGAQGVVQKHHVADHLAGAVCQILANGNEKKSLNEHLSTELVT